MSGMVTQPYWYYPHEDGSYWIVACADNEDHGVLLWPTKLKEWEPVPFIELWKCVDWHRQVKFFIENIANGLEPPLYRILCAEIKPSIEDVNAYRIMPLTEAKEIGHRFTKEEFAASDPYYEKFYDLFLSWQASLPPAYEVLYNNNPDLNNYVEIIPSQLGVNEEQAQILPVEQTEKKIEEIVTQKSEGDQTVQRAEPLVFTPKIKHDSNENPSQIIDKVKPAAKTTKSKISKVKKKSEDDFLNQQVELANVKKQNDQISVKVEELIRRNFKVASIKDYKNIAASNGVTLLMALLSRDDIPKNKELYAFLDKLISDEDDGMLLATDQEGRTVLHYLAAFLAKNTTNPRVMSIFIKLQNRYVELARRRDANIVAELVTDKAGETYLECFVRIATEINIAKESRLNILNQILTGVGFSYDEKIKIPRAVDIYQSLPVETEQDVLFANKPYNIQKATFSTNIADNKEYAIIRSKALYILHIYITKLSNAIRENNKIDEIVAEMDGRLSRDYIVFDLIRTMLGNLTKDTIDMTYKICEVFAKQQEQSNVIWIIRYTCPLITDYMSFVARSIRNKETDIEALKTHLELIGKICENFKLDDEIKTELKGDKTNTSDALLIFLHMIDLTAYNNQELLATDEATKFMRQAIKGLLKTMFQSTGTNINKYLDGGEFASKINYEGFNSEFFKNNLLSIFEDINRESQLKLKM